MVSMMTNVEPIKIPEGYKQTEAGVIPLGWESITIGGVAEFIGGSQPPKSTFRASEKDGYIRLIQIRDYKKDTYITFIPEHLAQKKCETDDIMIGRYGPPIFQILRGIKGAYNVALIKAIPNPRIVKEFLYYTLKEENLFQVMEILSQRSSGQTGVDLPALKAYPLALPSKAEQTSIANALSDVDNLIAALETLIAKKSAIKTAAMQQLLTGKKRLPAFAGERKDQHLKANEQCTAKPNEQHRTQPNSASDTPTQHHSDAENNHHQQTPRPGYKHTELGEIPQDWEVTPLEAMVGFNNGSAHENHIKEYGNYIVVNSKFVSTEGRVAKYSDQCLCPVYKDNILMVMSDVPNGKAIAKCFLVDEDDKYTLNQRICAIDPKEMDSKYLFLILSRNSFYLQFDDGAKQTNLRRQDILDCPIPVPSIKEQIAISSALFDMDTELDALQQRLEKIQSIKQGMMQELLTGKTRLIKPLGEVVHE